MEPVLYCSLDVDGVSNLKKKQYTSLSTEFEQSVENPHFEESGKATKTHALK
jgi:hypothetical protein